MGPSLKSEALIIKASDFRLGPIQIKLIWIELWRFWHLSLSLGFRLQTRSHQIKLIWIWTLKVLASFSFTFITRFKKIVFAVDIAERIFSRHCLPRWAVNLNNARVLATIHDPHFKSSTSSFPQQGNLWAQHACSDCALNDVLYTCDMHAMEAGPRPHV